MRNLYLILGLFVASSTLADSAVAQVLQSSQQGGELWARRDGAQLQVVPVSGRDLLTDLPPGATIRQIELSAKGWFAAGRLTDGEGTDLLLLAGGDNGADLLPVPDRGKARYRGQPALFVDKGELQGLAWAAGDGPREFEIWAATWSGDRWGQPELISPVGPGSQVAPKGVVLPDGRWLLVWTAFDGQDSEVVWSQRLGGRWTAPEPIHLANDVPDVMPDVVSIDGGALVAWSWFDGSDYRLKTARLSRDGWLESEPFGGKGSGEPWFLRTDDRILLLYPSVEPRSWTVLEFDRSGDRRRQAVVPVDSNDRPLLLLEEGEAGLLRWPAQDYGLTWRDLP